MPSPFVSGVDRLGGWRRILVIALAAALASIVARQDWPRYSRLKAQGVGTDGWVTAKGLNGRGKVNYSFNVADRLYSGVGRSGYGNPEFDELSAGDKVIVFYLPKDPDVSVLGDPKEHLRDQNLVIVFCLALFTPVLVWALSRELKKASA